MNDNGDICEHEELDIVLSFFHYREDDVKNRYRKIHHLPCKKRIRGIRRIVRDANELLQPVMINQTTMNEVASNTMNDSRDSIAMMLETMKSKSI